MPGAPASHHVLLVMGDAGDERCGVGSSEVEVLAHAPGPVEVLDPTQVSVRAFVQELRSQATRARGAVLVYPTVSEVGRLDLVPRALAVRAVLRGRWVRVHLHEFDHLARIPRLLVALTTALVADRVVVSSAGEVDALRRRWRGLAAWRAEVVVAPPANPSRPGPGEGSAPGAAPPPEQARTVGVHGQYRPDKGIDWLLHVLPGLDERYDRLEIAGRGWSTAPWPGSIRRRFEIVDLGQVAREDLGAVFVRWGLALAPFARVPTDGRLSLRTPLAYGVPTVSRGPRPASLQLAPPHLSFDDEVDLSSLDAPPRDEREAGVAAVAAFEAGVRGALTEALLG